MGQKLNIAKILKNKPRGTKLYSMIHGKCSSEAVTDEIFKINFCTSKFGLTQSGECTLIKFGNMYDGGECIIFPSKEMRDWSKFAWKKGDVLVSKHGTKEVIFDGFDDDYYVTFKGKHALETIEGESEYKGESDDGYNYFYTENYYLESEDAAQTYINTLEKILGGKLNRETLEIEKQTEFKDGDIAFADYGNRQNVFVVSDKTDLSEGYSSFISLDLSSLTLSMGCRISFFKKDLCKLRLATEEEKKQFFSALEKEGKRWDSDKKAIVDLKPKVELKPFDKVLVRDFGSQAWQVSLFGYKDSDFYYCCNGCGWNQCIPYNEETAHLLGTTGEWKGGEG